MVQQEFCRVSTLSRIWAGHGGSLSLRSFVSTVIQVILLDRMQCLGTWVVGTQYPQSLGKPEWEKDECVTRTASTNSHHTPAPHVRAAWRLHITHTGGPQKTWPQSDIVTLHLCAIKKWFWQENRNWEETTLKWFKVYCTSLLSLFM